MKPFTTFITSVELNEILTEEDIVIIDCRFDLSNPEWGFSDYLKGHLPNAIYAHLDNDLSSRIQSTTGRHPLPHQEDFIKTCSDWGIDSNKQVVVYDTTSGSFAARLWWMLKYFNHNKVAILDGGYDYWQKHGYPIETGNILPRPSVFAGKPNNNLLVETSEMEELIKKEDWSIVDARSPERFSGKMEPIDSIAGRIPNSVNFFHQDNLDDDGKLLPNNVLEKKYRTLLNDKSLEKIVVYCGSGVTSCFNIAAMNHIGLNEVRLYLGSWSEWIRNNNHPIINDFS